MGVWDRFKGVEKTNLKVGANQMTYYVDFNNQTDRTWTMVVYQTIPDSIGLDSVAWKKTTVPKSGESGVEWEIDYLVALANYKQPTGVGVYKASQRLNASLGSKWKVVFQDGVQQLKADGNAQPGFIVINNESGNLADIGIGMSGESSVYKRNVLSGSGGQFKVTPTYYVGLFNDLVYGTVISSNVIVGPMTLVFPSGQNKAVLTASLDGPSITLDLQYQTALVANYQAVQALSKTIGSQLSEDSDLQNGNPSGHYTQVYVTPIQSQSGTLRPPSTGTYSDIGVFSCGDFTHNDWPVNATYYNISAKYDGDGQTYSFPGVKCVHSGKTSDFKKP
jgi:hypothetical protein